jgi:hypothetical protein
MRTTDAAVHTFARSLVDTSTPSFTGENATITTTTQKLHPRFVYCDIKALASGGVLAWSLRGNIYPPI